MEELDLKEIFNLFWNKKIQIALITIIFMIAGIIYTLGFVKPVYTASTTLVLARIEDKVDKLTGDTALTTSDLTLNSKLVSTYSELVKSKKVLRTVISNLGMKLDEEKLRKSVAVTSVKDTELIQIAVTDDDPAISAKVANEIAEVFIENVKEIYNLNNVHIVDEAETPDAPSNIHRSRDVIIFTFMGIVVSVVYVLLLNMLDTTIKSAEDVEKLLGLPVLASIPVYDFEGKNEKGGKRSK